MSACRSQLRTEPGIDTAKTWDDNASRWALRGILLLIIGLLLFRLDIEAVARDQKCIEVGSPEELLAAFERLNYTPESWEAGIHAVPRIYLMQVGQNWRINSRNLSVITKKRIFFRALGPLVLRANEILLSDRKRLIEFDNTQASGAATPVWVQEFAKRYKVTNSPNARVDAAAMEELLKRVDVVPPSLVLAQGAEESGWGFAAEGNSLFGQWIWSGKDIKVKDQRGNLGDYKIAAFETPLESVQAYLLNINSHSAYAALRDRRMQMRENGVQDLSGWELAESLTKYSERGADYVKSLHTIMKANKLREADNAVLVDGPEWHVYPKKQKRSAAPVLHRRVSHGPPHPTCDVMHDPRVRTSLCRGKKKPLPRRARRCWPDSGARARAVGLAPLRATVASLLRVGEPWQASAAAEVQSSRIT